VDFNTILSQLELQAPPPKPIELPPALRKELDDPAKYIPSKELLDAARVSLMLRKPLLLTGQAGTGKTQLASHMLWRLGLGGKLLTYETKSTSTATDLFYSYNSLAQFHAAQTKQSNSKGTDYIRFNALGHAILLTRKREEVQHLLPPDFNHDGPRPSLVLMDEVDKAPSDFPNDILNEIENLFFRIPELDNARVIADRQYAPVIILTSNSEKTLPAPFLRRCVYFHIPFPDSEQLKRIVSSRIKTFSSNGRYPLLDDALNLFGELRTLGLEKEPATAELLDWLLILLATEGVTINKHLWECSEAVSGSLSTLCKGQADQDKVEARVRQWLNQAPHK
jgi:MoxR-like ATPase